MIRMISSVPASVKGGGSAADLYSDTKGDNYGLGEGLAFHTNSLDNIAIGENALNSTSAGISTTGAALSNIAIGTSALTSLTDADYNIAIGTDALTALLTGSQNVAIGFEAMSVSNGAESGNVAIGYRAGKSIDDSSTYNTVIGFNAGTLGGAVSTGNVVIGNEAMNSTGANVQTGTIAIGSSALTALTSGAGNLAIGYQALLGHTTGARNTAIGHGAMDGTAEDDAPTSTDNIFIGYDAGGGSWDDGADGTDDSNFNVGKGNYCMDAAMDGALKNTAVGYDAGTAVTTGSQNTLLGFQSGLGIVGGNWNTCLGDRAGDSISSGGANTCIGTTSDCAATGTNQIAIGNGAISTASNQAVIGNSDVTDVHMASDSGAIVHSGALVNGLSALLVTTGTLAYATHSIVRGKYVTVSADAQTLTLPAVIVGAVFIIVNIAADGGALLTIDPNGSDKFLLDIAGAAGTDGNTISNTKATQNQGDFVKLVGMSADGWAITEIGGIWADE